MLSAKHRFRTLADQYPCLFRLACLPSTVFISQRCPASQVSNLSWMLMHALINHLHGLVEEQCSKPRVVKQIPTLKDSVVFTMTCARCRIRTHTYLADVEGLWPNPCANNCVISGFFSKFMLTARVVSYSWHAHHQSTHHASLAYGT